MIGRRTACPLLFVAAIAPAGAGTQPETRALVEQAEPAHAVPLVYDKRTITTLRARIVGRPPAERAESVKRALDALVAARTIVPKAHWYNAPARASAEGRRPIREESKSVELQR